MSKINASERNTISCLLAARANSFPNDTAYCFPELEQHCTWLKLWEETRLVAKGLLGIGVQKGDRVALLMQGRMEMIVCMYAAASIGAVILPLNAYSKKDELQRYFQEARPVLVVAGPEGHHINYPQLLQSIVSEAELSLNGTHWVPNHIFVLKDDVQELPGMFKSFASLTQLGKEVSDETFRQACESVGSRDPLILLYTSGTSGKPKGVLRTTLSFLGKEESGARKTSGETLLGYITDRIASKTSVLNLLPLYHIGGFSLIFTTLKVCNIRAVLLTRFHPVDALAVLERERCKVVSGTPFMIQQMLSSPRRSDYDLSSLLGIAFTSAVMNKILLNKVCNDPGLRLLFFMVSYGSSEAGKVATGVCFVNQRKELLWRILYKLLTFNSFFGGSLSLAELEHAKYSFGGKVEKGVEIKIAGLEADMAPHSGVHGEILIRSHRVMHYMGETPQQFTEDGWYRSGDLGFMDERRNLLISGRMNRVIVRGGEKISPTEIENVLLDREGVAEAFVLGIPDELYGELVCACIIPHEGEELDETRLREEMLPHLSAFKIPRFFVFMPSFPMSATGKLSVPEMRHLVMEQLGKQRQHA